jgi:microcystin-dependent protein
LRVVSGTAGSGGSVAFTTAFASQAVSGSIGNTTATNQTTTAGGTVGATTLSTSQIPSHTHNLAGNNSTGQGIATRGWSRADGRSIVLNTDGPVQRTSSDANAIIYAEGGSGSHTHSFSGTSHNHTQDAHNHSFTGTAIDLAVQYVDVIIATKD